jgi:hypothetical protein
MTVKLHHVTEQVREIFANLLEVDPYRDMPSLKTVRDLDDQSWNDLLEMIDVAVQMHNRMVSYHHEQASRLGRIHHALCLSDQAAAE